MCEPHATVQMVLWITPHSFRSQSLAITDKARLVIECTERDYSASRGHKRTPNELYTTSCVSNGGHFFTPVLIDGQVTIAATEAGAQSKDVMSRVQLHPTWLSFDQNKSLQSTEPMNC